MAMSPARFQSLCREMSTFPGKSTQQLTGNQPQAGAALWHGTQQPVLPLQGPAGSGSWGIQPGAASPVAPGAGSSLRSLLRGESQEKGISMWFLGKGTSPKLGAQLSGSWQHGRVFHQAVTLQKAALPWACHGSQTPEPSKLGTVRGMAELAGPQHTSKRCSSVPSALQRLG